MNKTKLPGRMHIRVECIFANPWRPITLEMATSCFNIQKLQVLILNLCNFSFYSSLLFEKWYICSFTTFWYDIVYGCYGVVLGGNEMVAREVSLETRRTAISLSHIKLYALTGIVKRKCIEYKAWGGGGIHKVYTRDLEKSVYIYIYMYINVNCDCIGYWLVLAYQKQSI